MPLNIDLERVKGLPPADRKRVEVELARLQELHRLNPLLGYEPHGKQLDFHEHWARTRAFFGGNRSGKTHGTIADDIIQAIDREAVPEHLRGFKRWNPPFYGRVVVPSFKLLEAVTLEKMRELVPKGQLKAGRWDKAFDKQLFKLHFRNGSWIDFLTHEQDVDKFSGSALHRVHLDEEPQGLKGFQIYKECRMRLIDYGGEMVVSMTPLLGLSWSYEAIWEKRGQDNVHCVVADMDDNPHLDAEERVEAMEDMSSEEIQARKQGRFVHFAGLIYDFKPSEHIVPQASITEGCRVIVGIDTGIKHACAAVWISVDSNDKAVIVDELKVSDTTIPDVCRLILEKNEALDVKPFGYVIDPASRNRANQTGKSDQVVFSECGVHAFPANNQVEQGLHRVKERLETDRLHVQANCTGWLDEVKRYRWRTDSGRGQDDPKERPVKQNDHLMDATRYAVMSLPRAPKALAAPDTRSWDEKLVSDHLASLKRPRYQSASMGAIFS